MKAEIVNQLMISVNNKMGALAKVSTLISAAAINMIAICAYTIDQKGFIMFVSDDNKRALKLLKEKGYNIWEEEAVLATIDNKPGALQSLAKMVADEGIDLDLIYGSVNKKGKTSPIVLVSEKNPAVLTLIQMNSGKKRS